MLVIRGGSTARRGSGSMVVLWRRGRTGSGSGSMAVLCRRGRTSSGSGPMVVSWRRRLVVLVLGRFAGSWRRGRRRVRVIILIFVRRMNMLSLLSHLHMWPGLHTDEDISPHT